MMTEESHEILIYSKDGCHLCESARKVIESVIQGRLDVSFNEIILGEDHPLYEKYAELFPVIAIDGREIAYWRIDRRMLMSALEESA